MFDIGGGELLLIVLVILIMFGPKKLPELAQSLGRGMREFKRAQREFTEQINTAMSDEQRRERARSSHVAPTDTVPRTPLFASKEEDPEEMTFTSAAEHAENGHADTPAPVPPQSAQAVPPPQPSEGEKPQQQT